MKTIKTVVLLAVFCLLTGMGYAQTPSTDVPKTITYQGMINAPDGTPIVDGQYTITVTFYADAAGTSRVWQGTYPATVTKGIFNVMLGSGASPFATTAMFNQPLWVGVKVGDGDEMRPLSQLSSAPSALGISDSSITSPKMATPYVAGITVNGTPITGVGSTVNLVGAGATSLLYDQQTNSIIVNAGATASNGDTVSKDGSFKGTGGGARTEGTNQTIAMFDATGLPANIINSSITDNGTTVSTSDHSINVTGGSDPSYEIGSSIVLHNYGTNNIFLGANAGNATMTGHNNTGIGVDALPSTTSGYINTAVGEDALEKLQDGYYNTALGSGTLGKNISGVSNTAVGNNALANSTASYNTAVGESALYNDAGGESNTAIGLSTLASSTTGSWNSATGVAALENNTLGDWNTANGGWALSANTTGQDNTAIGEYALALNTTASYNTAIGDGALEDNTTGSYNSSIGNDADVSSNNLINATSIGANAKIANGDAMQLGDTNYALAHNDATGGYVATYGHIRSEIAPSSPTSAALGANAGGFGALITPTNLTDVAGKITVKLGAGASWGTWISVTFAHQYANAPNVVISPADGPTAQQFGSAGSSTTGFTIVGTPPSAFCSYCPPPTNPSAGASYTWYYVIVESK